LETWAKEDLTQGGMASVFFVSKEIK
jgi:hypothetical protein